MTSPNEQQMKSLLARAFLTQQKQKGPSARGSYRAEGAGLHVCNRQFGKCRLHGTAAREERGESQSEDRKRRGFGDGGTRSERGKLRRVQEVRQFRQLRVGEATERLSCAEGVLEVAEP